MIACHRVIACATAATSVERCHRYKLELSVEHCLDNLVRGVRQERPLSRTGVQRKCLRDAKREPDRVLRFDLMDAPAQLAAAHEGHRAYR